MPGFMASLVQVLHHPPSDSSVNGDEDVISCSQGFVDSNSPVTSRGPSLPQELFDRSIDFVFEFWGSDPSTKNNHGTVHHSRVGERRRAFAFS